MLKIFGISTTFTEEILTSESPSDIRRQLIKSSFCTQTSTPIKGVKRHGDFTCSVYSGLFVTELRNLIEIAKIHSWTFCDVNVLYIDQLLGPLSL